MQLKNNDSRVDCRAVLTNIDRLQVVYASYSYVLDMWDKASCERSLFFYTYTFFFSDSVNCIVYSVVCSVFEQHRSGREGERGDETRTVFKSVHIESQQRYGTQFHTLFRL